MGSYPLTTPIHAGHRPVGPVPLGEVRVHTYKSDVAAHGEFSSFNGTLHTTLQSLGGPVAADCLWKGDKDFDISIGGGREGEEREKGGRGREEGGGREGRKRGRKGGGREGGRANIVLGNNSNPTAPPVSE